LFKLPETDEHSSPRDGLDEILIDVFR
jgi:hypothetical protein